MNNNDFINNNGMIILDKCPLDVIELNSTTHKHRVVFSASLTIMDMQTKCREYNDNMINLMNNVSINKLEIENTLHGGRIIIQQAKLKEYDKNYSSGSLIKIDCKDFMEVDQ